MRVGYVLLALCFVLCGGDGFAQQGDDYGDAYRETAPIIDVPQVETPQDIELELAPVTGINEEPQKEWPRLIGTFKILDKVTGKVRYIRVPSSEIVAVGSLEIVMRACVTAPLEDAPETTAFVEIGEVKTDGVEQLFSGWMFASSPGLNALEHAVYDVWPVICRTPAGEIFSNAT